MVFAGETSPPVEQLRNLARLFRGECHLCQVIHELGLSVHVRFK